MYKIEAIIKGEQLPQVVESLKAVGITGMTVQEVRGFGRQNGYQEHYRGLSFSINFLPKIKVEVVVPEERAEETAEAIVSAAKTGEIGDGKVFIIPVVDAIRVRTRERGPVALQGFDS